MGPMLRAHQFEATVPDRADVSSYAELYEDAFSFVWMNLRRLGVHEAAIDDAVQDVFLVVHRRLGDFEGRSSVRTWLFGIVVRVTRNHRRSAKRFAAHIEAASHDSPPAPSPAELVAEKEAIQILEEILDGMDDDKREVFVQVELEQMSVADVALALELNVNTAHARLRAAREEFARRAARFRAREQSETRRVG